MDLSSSVDSSAAPDADSTDVPKSALRTTLPPNKRRRHSAAEDLVSHKIAAQDPWPLKKSISSRAVSYLTTIAALRSDSSHEVEEAVTDGKQYEEIMDRFQVRLRQNSLDKGLPTLGSLQSLKVQPAQDSDRSTQARHFSSQTERVPSKADFDLSRQEIEISAQSPNEPNESEEDLLHQQLSSRSDPQGSSRFSLRRRLDRLGKRVRAAAASRLQNLRSPMSPYSNASRMRSALLVFSCFAYAVILPIELAFYSVTPNWLIPVGKAVDVMLLVDVILMFNTSFVDKRGAIVIRRWEIVVHYLKGSFLSDVLSSIAIYWLQTASNQQAGRVKWYLLALDIIVLSHRVLHLLHAFYLAWFGYAGRSGKSIWNWLLYSRYSHLIRISWIISLVILLSHYMACFWKLLDVNVPDPSVDFLDDYAMNFYGALQLLQGQGLPTETVSQNFFASVAVLAGSVVLAIVFGHVAMLVSNFNANTTSYQRKMESVFAITTKMQLPVPLRERIHQYYEHLWREYDSLDGEIVDFSKDLTCNLTLEVVLFKYMVLVMHVPFWRTCSVDFQKQIALHLKARVYLPDDFIMRRGEVNDELYVINRGFCEMESDPDSFEHASAPLHHDPDEAEDSLYTSELKSDAILSGRNNQLGNDPDYYPQRPPSKNLTQLSRGQAFGEIALLMNYERTANVRAVSYVEMCVLTRSAFQEVLKKYPRDRRHVIMQVLTTFMDQNEAKRGLCPLKHMVHSVIHGGDSRIPLATQRAAQLVAEVIDPKLHDETMMFGIDDNLAQQLSARKNDRKTESGIYPALEARLQQIEEAQVQMEERIMGRIQHIDQTLVQVMRLVQDHVANPLDATHRSADANPQSPTVQTSISATHPASDAAEMPNGAGKSLLLRAHSSPLVRLRSRSASMTMIQSTTIVEEQPQGTPDLETNVDPDPTLHTSQPVNSSKPEPRCALDALPMSPEIKRSYLVRANTVTLLRSRSSSAALLRSRSSSMTKLQTTNTVEDKAVKNPTQKAENSTTNRLRPKNSIRRRTSNLTDADKQPKRRRNSSVNDRASIPELFGRLLPFGFNSESSVQSPTLYADQLFQHSNT